MISTTNLTMRFGGKILFSNVSLQFNPGQHYGLVGANGSGKSTFIKMLAGEVTADGGDISMPSQCSLGVLKQNHFLFEENSLLDVVLMGKPKLWNALQARDELLQKDPFDDKDCDTLASLEKIIEAHQGYSASSVAGQLLEGLGLPTAVHTNAMKSLSGGYKLRVLLAQVLFSEPDVLLLDEPTNHLDIFSIRWLEGYLRNFPGTLLVCSHDREFLNGTCNHIVDADYGTLKIYKGNYDSFEETKARERELKEAMLDKHDKKRQDVQEFIDRFKSKASKARQAQSKMRVVEKLTDEMDKIDLCPTSRAAPRLRFDQCRPSAAIPLTVKEISKAYGDKEVLKGVSFQVERGERIAILGANGMGKSTLLEILTDSIPTDQGAFEWGYATHFAYFPQDHAKHVFGKQSVLEWLSQSDRQIPEEKLRQTLGLVLFSGDDVHKPLSVLSGGEAARLILAKMLLTKHNVLIFDEPTNHLDMESTEALLEALQAYPGSILFVSHNRYFVSRIANRILEITPQHGLMDFKCTFSEYLEKRDFDLLSANKKHAGKVEEKPKEVLPQAGKGSYEDQKQQKRLKDQLGKKVSAAEDKIHKLEKEIEAVDQLLASEGFYQTTQKEQQEATLQKKADLEKRLAAAFTVWEELAKE
jgi:ATPase subunit of ABC transporter with duplicated ATPase domains